MRLADENERWDAVHFSGHGLAGGLVVLEKEDGTQDQIPLDVPVPPPRAAHSALV